MTYDEIKTVWDSLDEDEKVEWVFSLALKYRPVQQERGAIEALVPPGWKLVPDEPTKEMIARACKDHGYPGGSRRIYRDGYRSMLDAAPSAPDIAITEREECTGDAQLKPQ